MCGCSLTIATEGISVIATGRRVANVAVFGKR
jgi:hypothetical protein